MKRGKAGLGYFTKGELVLWGLSVLVILGFFFMFDRNNSLSLVASLVGVTSLILNAKGNPIGQMLMILFSVLYGFISCSFAYYGEMMTYLGMTAPMAVAALVSWLKHPFQGKRSQVTVRRIHRQEVGWMFVATAVVTVVFYYILKFFRTANLIPSTISVTTSFMAAYLTLRRSAWFALAYAANDVVLIVLWLMAATTDASYLSVVVCFGAFLVNDLYGFINWLRMEKHQKVCSEGVTKFP